MRILLTNDDGILAAGLQTLCQELESDHQITVVAPDRERSATGHAITIHSPLRAQSMEFEGLDSRCIAVDGTPADSVKLALESLVDEEFDLLISGINAGPNLGHDVLYSGTVSAAVEGMLNGLPAIATSLATYQSADFQPGAEFISGFIDDYLQYNLSSDTLLNINFPAPQSANGQVKVTKLGDLGYNNSFEERVDPMGEDYYWLAGEVRQGTEQETDLVAVEAGYISITPLEFNLTAEDKRQELADWDL